MKVRGAKGEALRAAVTFRAVARRAGAEKGRGLCEEEGEEAKGEGRRGGLGLGCAEPEGLRTAPGAPEAGASGRCIRLSGIRTAGGSGAAGLMGARVDLSMGEGFGASSSSSAEANPEKEWIGESTLGRERMGAFL